MTTNDQLPGELKDEILARRVTQGDSAALEALYDRYAPAILAMALKILRDRRGAEEVLQETFWRVWKHAGQYQPERGAFAGWLFRITRNLALDTYRRNATRPQETIQMEGDEPILDRMPDPDMDTPAQSEGNLKARQVQAALRNLPPAQRRVIELAYFYGMTRQEIATQTGEALGTIHTRARLGLQRLREILEQDSNLPEKVNKN